MERPIERHIDFLDPMRGIAILFVFAYHSLGTAFGQDQLPWGRLFSTFDVPRSFIPLLPVTFGWVGVTIFFVVSGFCIHLSFSRQPQWPVFFKRRFFRIYPPYLVTLLFFALVYPMSRIHFTSREDAWQFLSHLVLLHNLDGRWVFGINPAWWSIAVEVQLYALYPVLIALARRFGWRRTLMGTAAIELALRLTGNVLYSLHGTGFPRWVCDSPFFFWFSWALGAFVAELYLRGKCLPVPRATLCALGASAVACKYFMPLTSMTFPLFALVTAGIITRLLQNTDRQLPIPAFFLEHLRRVGLWSFSLYLVHQPLIFAVPKIAAWVTSGTYIHPLLMFGLCLSSWFAIVPMARVCYQLFELPGIAFGKRFYAPKNAG